MVKYKILRLYCSLIILYFVFRYNRINLKIDRLSCTEYSIRRPGLGIESL